MKPTRRSVLKGAGALAALAAAQGVAEACMQVPPVAAPARKLDKGMSKGLTLLTFRPGTGKGDYRLGVKTQTPKGILDVAAAAKALHMHAPATMDDLLQNEDGPSLNALVEAALKSPA